jgi:hypothetical protein
MRRAALPVFGLVVLTPVTVVAGPPVLPDAETSAPAPAPPADPTMTAGASGTAGAMPPAGTAPAPTMGASAGTAPAMGAPPMGAPAADPTMAPLDPTLDASASLDGGLDAGLDGGLEDGGEPEPMASGPGIVEGRPEPVMNTLRGGVGLFHTSMPWSGGKNTVRMRVHLDSFRKSPMFLGGDKEDTHTRHQGAVTMGWSPLEYLEVFGVYKFISNKNVSDAGAQSLFAFGDFDLGAKGSYRFAKGGVGLGGQMGVGIVQGAGNGLPNRSANFNIDALVGADLRYLTAKQVPVRFNFNLGWILDNTTKLFPWDDIADPIQREITRFSLGVNHNRVRTRIGVDFPIRVGKRKQVGIDPLLEYSWDISTEEVEAFTELTEMSTPSPVPRSMSWVTVGLRANLWQGFHIDAGLDFGTASPNFEFGPPVPQAAQGIIGLGWSFDPTPRVKEVAAETDEDELPPPALDGRVVGVVYDVAGAPVPGAQVYFPGLSGNAVMTDAQGSFVSFRFPQGQVTIQVVLPDGSVVEQVATVAPGQDTRLDLQAQAGGAAPGVQPQPAADFAIVDGAFIDANGMPVIASMRVTGMGIDEAFQCNAGGRVAVELPNGQYTISISAPGFADQVMQLDVAGQPQSISATMMPGTPGAPGAPGAAAGPAMDTPNVVGSARRIRLKKKVRYKGDAVADKSFALLDELAMFLNGHPEYASVEVRVHTDDRGKPSTRSRNRANAVKAYLVSKGVDGARIKTRGMGDKNPIAVNLTPEGRAKNNRTEFSVSSYTGQ